MAFQNVIMPKIKLVHGVTKQIVDPVMVVGNGNRETRRKQNRYERFVWQYPSRAILDDSKQELYQFFRSTNSSLDSFLFQDPDFPEFTGQSLTHKTGSTWYLELPGGHPIINPVMSGLTFKVNGVTQSATFATDDAGRPTVSIAGSSAVSTISVFGLVYLTVRLNSPLSWSIAALEPSANGTPDTPAPIIVDLGDISLIEVFEYA